ncbi:MAG: endoribonuclease [Proteobacteria bacterium]|nr:endoribonuclease [Pseudomonadota bacterium]
MDDVVKRCAKRCLKEKNHLKYIQETIIQKTHGFSYNDHFRKMLISIIGLTNFEKMEKNSDPKKLSDFCASLSYLVPNRNSEAHTYLKGTTKKIDAPSQTIGHFIKLHVGIHEIEKWLKANGF